MTTPRARRLAARFAPIVALVTVVVAGCTGAADPGDGPESIGETPSTGSPSTPIADDPFFPIGPMGQCNAKLSVKSHGSALIVHDPAALTGFTLKRVLQQLLDVGGDSSTTPEQLLQQLFDTENTTLGAVYPNDLHCDGPMNGAFKNGPAVDCPRAEGALAKSTGLFTEGSPDYFAPIAVVNRLDLMPSTLQTCGEYRIIFAKWSGRNDPSNRVFLIFEGALQSPSPGNIEACRPVAEMWAGLDSVKDPAVLAKRLEQFYFTGLPGILPLVHPLNLGLFANDDDPYGASHGQVRLSQRMQAPFEMREFRVGMGPALGGQMVGFFPATVKNNPLPELFDPSTPAPLAPQFRMEFAAVQVAPLSATSVAGVRMGVSNMFAAGESAIGGAAQASYWGRVTSGGDGKDFLNMIDAQLAAQPPTAACPPGDPLTARSILDRAAVQTCAGCHAPTQFLGADRKIGCGLVWPNSLGEVHIDEHGTLSPALTEVLMPRRAAVMTTYLQDCDQDAIFKNLVPTANPNIPK
ncbi:MAG: hypothetical protein ABJE95_13905 [Byssovorax sp.]